MNPKEPILEPTLPQELNVSEGIESLEELEWESITDQRFD